jgi:hypothetical protein
LAKRLAAPITKIHGIFFCLASPVRGVKIAALLVLAQHKEHERIGEARKFLPRFAFWSKYCQLILLY